jgi:hypothetical protein
VIESLKDQLGELNNKAKCGFKVIDNGSQVALSFNNSELDRHILRMPPNAIGSKKKALTLGIEQSNTDWIITTDADTLWNQDWLNSVRRQAMPGTSMLIGPVFSKESNSYYSLLSYYESLCLWTISSASCHLGIPILASGANLAFKKTSWQQVGGYVSHINKASGDDVLLMADIAAKFPHEIVVLKGRHAYTSVLSESNFLSWMAQHKRWISKTDHLNSPLKKGYALLLLVWLLSPLLLYVVHPLFPVLWFLMEYLWILRLTQWYRLHSQLLKWLFFRVVYPLTIPLILLSTPKAWK